MALSKSPENYWLFIFNILFFLNREFYENRWNENTGKLLFAVCQRLCHMLGADVPMITPHGMNLPAVIHELAGQAATLCSPGNSCYYLLAFMLGAQLSKQCSRNLKTKRISRSASVKIGAAKLFPFNRTYEPSIPATDPGIFTDLVLDCLELCKYTSLAKAIHGQCQMDNYEFTAEVFSVLFTVCIIFPLISPAL